MNINNVNVSAIKTDSVVIKWNSTVAGTSQIEYGTTIFYDSITSEDSLFYFHIQTISGLSTGTLYHYCIRSKEYGGAETISLDYTFITRTYAELEAVIKAARADKGLPKTYYVKTDGNNANDGLTITTAWKNPSYAASKVDVGDTIYLIYDPVNFNDGIWYDEQIVFSKSGIDVAPIILTAYNNTPTLKDSTKLKTAFYIDNTNYITIKNINVEGYKHAFYVLDNTGLGGDYINIINNTISNTSNIAIFLHGVGSDIEYANVSFNKLTNVLGGIYPLRCRNCTISSNNINNVTGSNGIAIGSSDVNWNLTISENLIDNSTWHGISFYLAPYTIVRNNTITHAAQSSIRFDYNNYNIIIENNTITDDAGVAIYDNNDNITFRNNTLNNSGLLIFSDSVIYIYNNSFINSRILYESGATETVTEFYSNYLKNTFIDMRSIKNSVFRNNLFINTYVIFIITPATNVTLSNNVFYSPNINRSAIEISQAATNNIYIKNNIFMNVTYAVVKTSGLNVYVSYNNLWDSGGFSGVTSTNTLNSDPLFADPINGDFHLKSQAGRWNGTAWVNDSVTSPAIDAGDPTSDYSNEPAPNGGRINMGAYGNTDEASKSVNEGCVVYCNFSIS